MSSRQTGGADATTAGRLGSADWIDAALTALADDGIAGVRIEVLARKLGVTKGSFYWHFKDRGALLDGMLSAWRHKSTLQVMERFAKDKSLPQDRLEQLLALPFASPRATLGSDVELAIRLWGRNDQRARAALKEVDELRLRFIASIFSDLGFADENAEARASLVYGFMRVGNSLPVEQARASVRREIEAILLASNANSGPEDVDP